MRSRRRYRTRAGRGSAVAQVTLTRPDAARLRLTAKSMVSSSPSLARASATETATGPLTVAEIVLVRRRRGSPFVHTASGESQARGPPAA